MDKPLIATLIMKRTFNVPSEDVFEAWIYPQLMRKWLFTTETTNRVARSVPQVGGTWEIVDHHNGKDYQIIGEYKEIEPPEKLMSKLLMPQFSKSVDSISVQIKPLETGCKMTFIQDISLPPNDRVTEGDIEKALKEYHDQTEHGWGHMFDKLQNMFENRYNL